MPHGISLGHSLVISTFGRIDKKKLLGANPRLCWLHLMRDDDVWRLPMVTLRRLVVREWKACGFARADVLKMEKI